MRRLILIFLASLSVAMVFADTGKSLFVTFTDNTKVEFALSTLPVVTVADDKLTVTTTATTAVYDLQTVSTFIYGTTTGIGNAQLSQPIIDGDRLIVPGSAHSIRIFAIDGTAVRVSPVVASGSTVVSLAALPHGVYIININGKAIKIAKP